MRRTWAKGRAPVQAMGNLAGIGFPAMVQTNVSSWRPHVGGYAVRVTVLVSPIASSSTYGKGLIC